MTYDPAILEAAARALRDQLGSVTFAGRSNLLPLSLNDVAGIVLAAVTPLIRNAALDKATNAARGYFLFRTEDTEDVYHVCEAIAARIRALKEQP
jgi:hypothetical protein